MDNFYWINKGRETTQNRERLLSSQNSYSPIRYTSYERSEFDEKYMEQQQKAMQYSETRNEVLKQQYESLYGSGNYESEYKRRNLAKMLNVAFPEFSEDYYYNNTEGFIKSATGIDADIDTYWEHISNVWDSTWKSTGTAINMAYLYANHFLGDGDEATFRKDKQIVMDRIRTNGQQYRKQDYEDDYGFVGKAFSKLVEQSPNLIINGMIGLSTAGVGAALSTVYPVGSVAALTAKNAIKSTGRLASAIYAGVTEMGSTALEMSQYGFDDDIIFGVSLMQGLFTGTLEGYLENMVFSGTENFIDKMFAIGGSSTGKIVDASFKAAARQFGASYLKEMVQEPAEEALESINGNALYNIAVSLQRINDKEFKAKFKSVDDFVNDALNNAKEALWSTSISALGGASLDISADYIFGDANKTLRTEKFMINDNADLIISTEPLKNATKKVASATKDEMKSTKAKPIEVRKVGIMFYPLSVDKYQKFAIDNGKYAFVRQTNDILIDKKDIDTSSPSVSEINAKQAETKLQDMYTSNAIDSYAYIDNEGNVLSDNSAGNAEYLVLQNQNGTDYYRITDNINTQENTGTEQKIKSGEGNLNVTDLQNKPATANDTSQRKYEKTSYINDKNDGFSLSIIKGTANTNQAVKDQERIQSQLISKKGLITYKQFNENISSMTEDNKLYDRSDYVFTDMNGRLLSDGTNASYMAFRRNGGDSFDLVRISKTNTPDKILSVFNPKKSQANVTVSVTDKKKNANEDANNTVAQIKESPATDTSAKTNSHESTVHETSTAEKKEVDYLNEPTSSPEHTNVLYSDDISDASYATTGTPDEKQKKLIIAEGISAETGENVAEVAKSIDSKVVPMVKENDTGDTYMKKITDFIVGIGNESYKEKVKKFLNISLDGKNGSTDLMKLMMRRIKGKDLGNKKRNQLVDDLLMQAKAQWTVDRTNKNMPEQLKKRLDNYFSIDVSEQTNDADQFENEKDISYNGTQEEQAVTDNVDSHKAQNIEDNKKAEDNDNETLKSYNTETATEAVSKDKNSEQSVEESKSNTAEEAKDTGKKEKKEKKETEENVRKYSNKEFNQILEKVIGSSFKQENDGTVIYEDAYLSKEDLTTFSKVLRTLGTDIMAEIEKVYANAVGRAVAIYKESGLSGLKNPRFLENLLEYVDDAKAEAINAVLSTDESDRIGAIDMLFEEMLFASSVRFALLNDEKIATRFFESGKDWSGKFVSPNTFFETIKNGRILNWNNAVTSIAKKLEKMKSEAGAKATTEKKPKAVSLKDRLFSNSTGSPMVDSTEMSSYLQSNGLDKESSDVVSVLVSCFSPSVQKNLYERMDNNFISVMKQIGESTGKKTKQILGRTIINGDTIRIELSENTDATTVIHELGHVVLNTSPEISENISMAFSDATDMSSEFSSDEKSKYGASNNREMLKNYITEHEAIFRRLIPEYEDAESLIEFIEDFTDSHSTYDEISATKAEKDSPEFNDRVQFEETVLAFMECRFYDDASRTESRMPTGLANVLKKVSDIFRKFFGRFGINFNPKTTLNSEIDEALGEIFSKSELESMPDETKAVLNRIIVANNEASQTTFDRTVGDYRNKVFTTDERTIDAYADHYVNSHISLDKTHGKVSISHSDSIKRYLPERKARIFREVDVYSMLNRMRNDGFFKDLREELNFLDEDTLSGIEEKIAKRLVYSKQTPVQEAFRLRNLAENFKSVSTLNNGEFKQKKNGYDKNGKMTYVPLTVGDVRKMNVSSDENEKKMYRALVQLESFFFGENGWMSEIRRNSDNINKLRGEAGSKFEAVKSRITDAMKEADKDTYVVLLDNDDVVTRNLFNRGRRIAVEFDSNTEIEHIYMLADLFSDKDGNPKVTVGIPNENSPFYGSGQLLKGPMVDLINYAMIDSTARNFNKDSYSTADMDYARVSYRMLVENAKDLDPNFDPNTFLFDKAIENLIGIVTDVRIAGKKAGQNLNELVNKDTSKEFLKNFIDNIKDVLKMVRNRNDMFAELDALLSTNRIDIEEYKNALKAFATETVTESKEIERLNGELSEKLTDLKVELLDKTRKLSEIERLEADASTEPGRNSLIARMKHDEMKFNEKISSYEKQIDDLISQINGKWYSPEHVNKLENDIKAISDSYDELMKENRDIQAKYDLLSQKIEAGSMLSELEILRQHISKTISFIKRNSNPEGTAFQSQMNNFYNVFYTKTKNGVRKKFNIYDAFLRKIYDSYRYLGVDSGRARALCIELSQFCYNAGMIEEIEGNDREALVRKTLDSLTISEIDRLMEILSELKKETDSALRQSVEQRKSDFREKRNAILDELEIKGSKNGISMRQYFDNIKVGSKEWEEKNRTTFMQRGLASVGLLAPQLREISPILYSMLYGGYINGKYNDTNLNSAVDSEVTGRRERLNRLYANVADAFNRYGESGKYDADYVKKHLGSMLAGTYEMGSMSLLDFEEKHGELSFVFEDGDLAPNFSDGDLDIIADYVSSKRAMIQRYTKRLDSAFAKYEKLCKAYGLDPDEDIHQVSIPDNLNVPDEVIETIDRLTEETDRCFDNISRIEHELNSDIGENMTYTADSLIGIFLSARQKEGVEHMLGKVVEDKADARIYGNGLSLGNILWVMDRFISDDEFLKYRAVAYVFQEEIASRASEIEAVRYRSKNKMMGTVDDYYTLVADPDTLMSFLNPSEAAIARFDSELIVGKTKNLNERNTRTRTGGNTAIKIGASNVLLSQIATQERYIAYTDIIGDMKTLIDPNNDANIISALKYAYGDSRGNIITEQIKSIIDSITTYSGNNSFWKPIFNTVRTGHIYKSLGFNLVSAMLQSTAYLFVADDIGVKNASKYFISYLKESSFFNVKNMFNDNLTGIEQDICDLSPQMANFVNTDTSIFGKGSLEQLLKGIYKLKGDEIKGMEKAENFSSLKGVPFKVMDWMNRNIAFATWYAYYNTYMNQDPSRKLDAEYQRYCANEATQKTMDITPNAFEKDTASLYKDNDTGVRNLLLFTSQLNKVFNKLYSKALGVKHGESKSVDVLKVVAVIGMVEFFNSMINGYIFGGDDEDEDSFIKRTLKGISGGIVESAIPVAGKAISDLIKGEFYLTKSDTLTYLVNFINDPTVTGAANVASDAVSYLELPGGFFNKIYKASRDNTPLWLLNYNWANVSR